MKKIAKYVRCELRRGAALEKDKIRLLWEDPTPYFCNQYNSMYQYIKIIAKMGSFSEYEYTNYGVYTVRYSYSILAS